MYADFREAIAEKNFIFSYARGFGHIPSVYSDNIFFHCVTD